MCIFIFNPMHFHAIFIGNLGPFQINASLERAHFIALVTLLYFVFGKILK